MQTDTESRPRRSRRRHRDPQDREDRRRRRPRSRGERSYRPSSLQREVRVWLKAADLTLSAIEQTAWELRHVADDTQRVWSDVVEDGRYTRESFEDEAGRLSRLTETGWMLTQLVGGYRLHQLRAPFLSERGRKASLLKLHSKNAKRYRRVSESHGGGFLKLGQMLSARPDLLPKVWIKQLTVLQDAAPGLPYETVREVIEDDLGKPIEELFKRFEQKPIAAASIGQVHRATTHEGQDVAVKVQRPGIKQVLELDLKLLDLFIEGVRGMLPPIDYDTVRDEIRSGLRGEVDYIQEATTMGRLHTFFKDTNGISVPEPVESLCGERVLTAQFIEGRKITDVLDKLRDSDDAASAARKDRILSRLLDGYLRQVLQAGVFQADPHPGNLLVTADDELVILDFGCTKPLEGPTRKRYLDLMSSFMCDDRVRMGQLFDELGFKTRSGEHTTLHAFTNALLEQFAQSASTGSARWPDSKVLLEQAQELLDAAGEDPVIKMPGEFIMVARVFGTLSGMFNHYQPDIDFGAILWPVIGEALIDSAETANA